MDDNVQQALIKAGETILAENRVPNTQDLSLAISNTQTGQGLMLLGMGAKNVIGLKNTLDAMSGLEEQIFSPETIAQLDIDQRTALHQEMVRSARFRHDFMNTIQETVDVAKLHVDLLEQNNKKDDKNTLSKDEKRVIRETLTRKVTIEYPNKAKPKPLSNVTDADYEEIE